MGIGTLTSALFLSFNLNKEEIHFQGESEDENVWLVIAVISKNY